MTTWMSLFLQEKEVGLSPQQTRIPMKMGLFLIDDGLLEVGFVETEPAEANEIGSWMLFFVVNQRDIRTGLLAMSQVKEFLYGPFENLGRVVYGHMIPEQRELARLVVVVI
jgi:hypothetical protein